MRISLSVMMDLHKPARAQKQINSLETRSGASRQLGRAASGTNEPRKTSHGAERAPGGEGVTARRWRRARRGGKEGKNNEAERLREQQAKFGGT